MQCEPLGSFPPMQDEGTKRVVFVAGINLSYMLWTSEKQIVCCKSYLCGHGNEIGSVWKRRASCLCNYVRGSVSVKYALVNMS